MKLSKRLETILSLVLPCETAADIGCDHGFTAIRLVEDGTAKRAVCSDVRPGPLSRAREHIEEAGLSGKISCREGDGLQTLCPGEADCVIIAGMGGALTVRILQDGKEILSGVRELVLSPHTDLYAVRTELQALGFRIDAEEMLFEEGKYYTVIRAVPGTMTLTEREAAYGPCLLRSKSAVFRDWIRYEIDLNRKVLLSLEGADTEAVSLAAKERRRVITELRDILGGCV